VDTSGRRRLHLVKLCVQAVINRRILLLQPALRRSLSNDFKQYINRLEDSSELVPPSLEVTLTVLLDYLVVVSQYFEAFEKG
jgi:hypothetical protein